MNDMIDEAQALIEAAVSLREAGGALREAETGARRAWTQEHVQPWIERFGQAQDALTAFCHTRLRDLQDVKRLLDDGHGDLVDRSFVAELKGLFDEADAIRRDPPQPPATISVEAALRQLRRDGLRYDSVENLVETVLGPPPKAFTSTHVDDAISRWTDFVQLDLPAAIRLDGRQGFIWQSAALTGKTLAQQVTAGGS